MQRRRAPRFTQGILCSMRRSQANAKSPKSACLCGSFFLLCSAVTSLRRGHFLPHNSKAARTEWKERGCRAAGAETAVPEPTAAKDSPAWHASMHSMHRKIERCAGTICAQKSATSTGKSAERARACGSFFLLYSAITSRRRGRSMSPGRTAHRPAGRCPAGRRARPFRCPCRNSRCNFR